MVIKNTLRETIKYSIKFIEYSQDDVDRILSRYPELEMDFYFLLKGNPKWEKKVEEVGKVYFILNKSLPYQQKRSIKEPKLRIGFVGKEDYPTISIDN